MFPPIHPEDSEEFDHAALVDMIEGMQCGHSHHDRKAAVLKKQHDRKYGEGLNCPFCFRDYFHAVHSRQAFEPTYSDMSDLVTGESFADLLKKSIEKHAKAKHDDSRHR